MDSKPAVMSSLARSLAPYAKAIRGALVAALGAVLVALTNGDGVTATEWVMVALAALGTGEGVYSTLNTTAAGVALPNGSFPIEAARIAPAPNMAQPATYETGRAAVEQGESGLR